MNYNNLTVPELEMIVYIDPSNAAAAAALAEKLARIYFQ